MNPFSAEQTGLLSLKAELNEIKAQLVFRKSLFRLQSELAEIKFDIELRQILRRGESRWLARVALWADFNTRRIEWLLARSGELHFKNGYNPDQPRVPAGNPDGGQWSSSSGDGQQARRIRLAGDITGFTKHGIDQAITRGVSPSSMHDAVVNPIQILSQANGTTRYVGRGAVVVLNPLGQVVTTWGQ